MTTLFSQIKPIKNCINGRVYEIKRIDKINISSDQLRRIESICNEPLVFQTLFSELFPDGVYPLSSAQDWITWGRSGWEQESHFVFAVLDSDGLVVAACDIKSNNKDLSEIGYWSSIKHRGIMTDSVQSILDLAHKAGFKEFYAEVHEDNTKSQAVLHRLGFIKSDTVASQENHQTYKKRANQSE